MNQVREWLKQWYSSVNEEDKRKIVAVRFMDILEPLVHGTGEVTPSWSESRDLWLQIIDQTRRPEFLSALPDEEFRNRWAEVIFRLLQVTGYGLLDMIRQRVEEHPDRILFREPSPSGMVEWTYEQLYRHLREIATLILRNHANPRVALYSENALEGAATDLACISYGIFVTPLSPHFKQDVLTAVFDRLEINTVFTDSPTRLGLLRSIEGKTRVPFRIYTLQPGLTPGHDGIYLPAACKRYSLPEIAQTLDRRTPANVTRVITTMFTSGSTGLPKGVSFSTYNLISKRFARAAALPEVGEQTFLCYLPLYHTFGRFLEMMGAIFWSGTYQFAGNTSAETLLSLFPRVNPTGFISIPLRWQELYERCLEMTREQSVDLPKAEAVRSVTGVRLQWGLSAAGYLDPAVFRFFNHHGIHLCSGFGMTEATGGITMTPPGQYRDDTVGIPLPGVYTRLSEERELQLRGHYIARYLEDAGPEDAIPLPLSAETDYWLPTGDVFRIAKDGYYSIVDRVKDIYKNNRGQTVAPQVIEKKFLHVPGIRSVFLAGDHRPYNVLLIVPDREDPLWKNLSGERITEYYQQIITAANADVAPYERVINFAVLDRDFSADRGELTPKGSFNRKVIEEHFHDVIGALYTSNTVTIETPDVTVLIPKWLIRDLGILEGDIRYRNGKLENRRTRTRLTCKRLKDGGVQLGDLKYLVSADAIDLGVFTRQPWLWIGNPELVRFCPVMEGWDVPVAHIADTVYMTRFRCPTGNCMPELKRIRDPKLIRINQLLSTAMFEAGSPAEQALRDLGELFSGMEPRLADVVRHRLEALAFHPREEIRTLAYRMILLKAPRPEQIPYMPAFIESGLSFLNQESIAEIIRSNFGKHRLDALKKRMHYYRTHLRWPANRRNRRQFESMLEMLYTFALQHMEFYGPVRAELSRWVLHRQDPVLSRKAAGLFRELAGAYERWMAGKARRFPEEVWRDRVTFEHGVNEAEKERILEVFRSTTFLEESLMLIFNDRDFSLDLVPDNGIWVLRMLAFKEFNHYRLSINTRDGRHYDLHVVLSLSKRFRPDYGLFYWLASLAGYPDGAAVAPLLGSNKPDFGVLSTQYIGGLTAWDKIREMSEIHQSAGLVRESYWKKIFVKAFTVIFRAWHHSGYQIIPGTVSPGNVVIPEMDFRESAVILSLTGWSPYTGPLSLVEPMLRDFYCKTFALYPWCRKQLQIHWIFDACVEALGKEEAGDFLHSLLETLETRDIRCFDDTGLRDQLIRYLNETFPKYHLPLALFNAVDQYAEWHRMNPLTTASAKEQTITELMELYKLLHYPDLIRYCFYRNTYFLEKESEVLEAFDRLTGKLQQNPRILPIQLLELSELQSVITDSADQEIFSRMVFPRLQPRQQIGFLKLREEGEDQVAVRFGFRDGSGKEYTLREPLEPREIGQLYQLFFREKYPKEPLENDRHLVLTDEDERVIGGITWRFMDEKNVLIDGIVVTSSLQAKGLGSSMMENFFASMAARGVEVVKAHFLFGNYYMKRYFTVDKQWGALVKTLV